MAWRQQQQPDAVYNAVIHHENIKPASSQPDQAASPSACLKY